MTDRLTCSLGKILAIGFVFFCFLYSRATVPDSIQNIQGRTAVETEVIEENEMGALFPEAERPVRAARHFSWGAEVGSSIDLTSHNLTTFDVNLNCGYRNKIFQLIGIGFGVQRSIGNSNTFIPFYGVLRTSFRSKPSNFFFNLKAGYSFNTLSSSDSKGGFLLSTGCGMVLKRTRFLTSYIMLAYGFYHINEHTVNDLKLEINHVDFAQIAFGISF